MGKVKDWIVELERQERESMEALIQSANNIGGSPDMWHERYGWVRVDGQLTENGIKFFADLKRAQENYNFSIEGIVDGTGD